jgi:hypothetical protein
MCTANYLRNRAPYADRHITPIHALTGQIPDLTHLKSWGCKVWVHVPKELQGAKFAPRAQQGIFLGYNDSNPKSFLVEINGGQVERGDVTFDEPIDPLEEVVIADPEPVQHFPPLAIQNRPHRTCTDKNRALTSMFADDVGHVLEVVEPLSYDEAVNWPDAPQWLLAMEEELVGLRGRGTWELCAASDKIKPLPVKWVFKVKRDDQGKVARFKARLVVMGCRQVEGVDYGEVFAPTGTPATLRTLLAIAAAGGWAVEGVDVTQAFLYGNLDEEVYIQQPAGFKDGSPRVCLLKKALYGLKQAPKVWYAELKGVLINTFGFVVSMADPCLFVHKSLQVYIHVYVDDMVVAGASAEHVNNIIQSISNTFKITRDGGLKHHLGMEVIRAGGSITLTQKRYTLDVLAKFDVSKLPRSLPLPPHPRLLQDMGAWSGGDAHIPLHRYGELIGCLLYLSVWTRPDISFAVGVLCRFMKDPTQHHMAAAINLLRYLLGTQGVGLVFGGAPILRAWSDADYAGSESDGKSTSGWLCTIGGAPVVWSSKKQSTVAASTCELSSSQHVEWSRRFSGSDYCAWNWAMRCSFPPSSL